MVSSYIAYIQCSVRCTHITPGHWTCSFMYHFNTLFGAYSTCSHFGARNYSHTLPSLSYQVLIYTRVNEACEGKVPCPRTQHRNNVPILTGEKHDIKILHQAGFETARQAATLAKLRALTIAPCPSLVEISFDLVSSPVVCIHTLNKTYCIKHSIIHHCNTSALIWDRPTTLCQFLFTLRWEIHISR